MYQTTTKDKLKDLKLSIPCISIGSILLVSFFYFKKLTTIKIISISILLFASVFSFSMVEKIFPYVLTKTSGTIITKTPENNLFFYDIQYFNPQQNKTRIERPKFPIEQNYEINEKIYVYYDTEGSLFYYQHNGFDANWFYFFVLIFVIPCCCCFLPGFCLLAPGVFFITRHLQNDPTFNNTYQRYS